MSFTIRIRIVTSISALFFLVGGSFCSAQNTISPTSFEQQLEILGYNVQTFVKQSNVTRFDLTRLLSAVECQDCLAAPESLIQKYNQSVWENFVRLPGKDFQDILYPRAEYNSKNYFLCVAYSADQGYVRGYPEDTSRFCAGRFCGIRATTWAEFLQVIVNILGKYAYGNFKADWNAIQRRYGSIPSGTYTKNTFTSADETIILSGAELCSTGECVLRSREQLHTYLKYCMFNLEQCGMQELPGFKRGVWPVAELNFLIKENVFSLDFLNTQDLNAPIPAQQMIQLLKRLNLRVQCSFDNDYDCDRVLNAEDNCPNTYNPDQKDIDSDGKGDVCDEDIDNDTIKNPVGIVDAESKVRIQIWQSGTDNCIFIPNKNQRDLNRNGYGDVCETPQGSLFIIPTVLKNQTPVVVQLQAYPEQTGIQRELGDGIQRVGNRVIHTYFQPGSYTVRAVSMSDPTVYAESVIHVPELVVNPVALQLQPVNFQNLRGSTLYHLKASGTGGKSVSWNVGGQNNISQLEAGIRGVRTGEGRIIITAQLTTGERALALAQFEILKHSTGVKYVTVRADSLVAKLDQMIALRSDVGGFDISQISNVRWDFDQGALQKIQNTKNLSIQTRYSTPGVKLVQQTVTLRDGSQFNSFLTLFVLSSETVPVSQTLFLSPGSDSVALGVTPVRAVQLVGNPTTLITNAPDGMHRVQQGNQLRLPEQLEYPLNDSFQRNPQASLQAVYGQCAVFKSVVTLSRGPADLCLDLKLSGKLSQLSCDMDGDLLPDLCDDDIDGDGVQNLLGVLRTQGSGCVYTSQDFQPSVLEEHFQRSCRLDNCPIDRNADQIDANINGKGDICEDLFVGSGTQNDDIDGDGILNSRDACLNIPENHNGFQDSDGCPEVGEHDICSQKPYTQPICVQCPCPYFDAGGDLIPGQQVRATLRDRSQRFLQGVGVARKFELPQL